MTTPLYWFTAVRPLSDSSGLAAAHRRAGDDARRVDRSRSRTGRHSAPALALPGLRSQVAWLTVPLLIASGAGAGSWGLGASGLRASARSQAEARQPAIASAQPCSLLLFLTGVARLARAAGHRQRRTGSVLARAVRPGRRGSRQHPDALDQARRAGRAGRAVLRVRRAVGRRGRSRPWRCTCGCRGPVAAGRRAAPDADRPRRCRSSRISCSICCFRRRSRAAMRCRSWCRWPISRSPGCVACRGISGWRWPSRSPCSARMSAERRSPRIRASPAPAFRLLDDHARWSRGSIVVTPGSGDGSPRVARLPRGRSQWIGDAMPPSPRTLPVAAAARVAGGGEMLERRRPSRRVWFVVDPLRASIDLVQHGDPLPFRWAAAVSGAAQRRAPERRWTGTASTGRSGTSAKAGR